MTDAVSGLEHHAEHAVPVSVPDSDAEEHTGGGNTRGTRQRFGNVRKLPSGRLQARYTGPDGQEHRAPITFDTKGDAQTWLALQSAAITESRWKPAPPPKEPLPTFGTYADQWLERRDLKPRTRSEYKRVLTGLKEIPICVAYDVDGERHDDMPTDQAAELVTPGKALFGLHTANQGRFIVFGGGFPLMEGGAVVGGIGVSGGSVYEDMLVAKAGLAAW